MASRELSELHPSVRAKAEQWLSDCRKVGIDVLIYCTYRSAAEQSSLYAIGRTVKGEGVTRRRPMGRIVTKAKAGESYHQYRCAWDAVPLTHGKAMWDDKAAYSKMGEIAATHGIEWAGRWMKMTETAHFQYTNGLTLSQLRIHGELSHE